MNSFFLGVAVTLLCITTAYFIIHLGDIQNKWKLRIIKNKRLIRIMNRDAENKRKAELEIVGYRAILQLKKRNITDHIGMNSTIL